MSVENSRRQGSCFKPRCCDARGGAQAQRYKMLSAHVVIRDIERRLREVTRNPVRGHRWSEVVAPSKALRGGVVQQDLTRLVVEILVPHRPKRIRKRAVARDPDSHGVEE